MKISSRKRMGLFAVVFGLAMIGVWDIAAGRVAEGIGVMAGTLTVAGISWYRINKIRDLENKGVNIYDERVMHVAGRAAQGAVKLFTLGLALFVGIGGVVGPRVTVNPYNFAGYLLAIILLLYVGLYYYHGTRA
ncbi:MAG: DUF2178 domain-containing protein [Methylocystaceae bacterium]